MSKKTPNVQFIASKIKALREESKWSQSELAKKSKVTPSAISMIESGQRAPSLVVIRKISDALKVSVAELTGESTQEESSQNAQAFFRQFGDIGELDKEDQDIILNLAKSLKERNNATGSS